MTARSRIGERVELLWPGAAGAEPLPAVGIILAATEPAGHYIVARFFHDARVAEGRRFAVAISASDWQTGEAEVGVVLINHTATFFEQQFLPRAVAILTIPRLKQLLKQWAQLTTKAFYEAIHQPEQQRPFVAGQDRISYAGRVFDEEELQRLVDSSLDFWLTAGPYADSFEKQFAEQLGVRRCALVNSGSSANLLAFAALTSPKLAERRIVPGDEVITVAAGFPTTVAPIIQYGAVPVFVDVTLPTYNVDCSQLEAALSPRSKAVMLAHTLGNPFDLAAVKAFCDRRQLWLIEDNCDALGARYFWQGQWRYTGTVGDLGTSSFYPPHHLTMGEGGAVYTQDLALGRLLKSFRDWGRDCWCPSGQDNTCNNRFQQQFGALPLGYDHKYVYSHFGYNLKVTEMQAAIGCAQLAKLPAFVAARQRNWQRLRDGCAELADRFILPEATVNADPSWFGFLLTVRDGMPFSRDQLVAHLEAQRIQTRSLFAGNLIKHPCFDEMRAAGRGYRVIGELANTERILHNAFWIGVYPGMSEEKLDYMLQTIKAFFAKA